MSNAAATMVGQALGAKDPARAEEAVWKAGFYNMLFLGAIGLLFVVAAEPIVRLFTSDPPCSRTARAACGSSRAGSCSTRTGWCSRRRSTARRHLDADVLNLGVFWLFEIPLAWALAVPLGWGPQGAFAAIAIAFSALAVVSALIFRRGTWKGKTV
jgi:Na+-driven multidrug efflux pump